MLSYEAELKRLQLVVVGNVGMWSMKEASLPNETLGEFQFLP